jgi:general secretion pathway protein D
MTHPTQLRLASMTRGIAVWAIIGLSLSVQAQTPQAKPSQTEALSTPSKNQLRGAEDAYLAGARLLERNDLTGAQRQFEKASGLDPANREYAMAVAITREHRVTELVQKAGKAHLLGQTAQSDALLEEARALDPENRIVTQHQAPGALPVLFNPEVEQKAEPWITQTASIAGPIKLLPSSAVESFHIQADLQTIAQQVVSSYGIRPVFDDSVPHRNIRFNLESVPYARAVHVLFEMGGLFAVPLDSKSVIVAKDTPENRARLERQVQETISIPGMTSQEINDLGNVVRNIFEVKQLTIEKNLGDLVLRAPVDTMKAVNLILSDLIDGGSEVMIELKLYDIDKTRQRNIGLQTPQQLGLYSVSGEAGNIVNQNQSLVSQAIAEGLVPAGASNVDIALALIGSGLVQSSLLSSTVGFFGGGLTQTGVTSNAIPTFNLAMNSSDSRALDDIQIRVGDGQSADFRVGTRYPITTSTYSTGPTTSSASLAGITVNGVSASSLLSQLTGGTSGVTIPQIQYEDLGLTLKATPNIQKSGNVSMHIDLKIEALSGAGINNIPILASRQFVSDITVNNDETALLVSALSKSESAAVSGLPGLGELPGFQSTTADTIGETDSSDLVLLITPHVIRRRSSIIAGPRIAFNLPHEPD